MKNLFEALEKFNKLVAGLSIILLAISYFILSDYYSQFSIDAFQYFNGSEILIASIKNLFSILGFFILPLLIIWGIIDDMDTYLAENKSANFFHYRKKVWVISFIILFGVLAFNFLVKKYSNQDWLKTISSFLTNEVYIYVGLLSFALNYPAVKEADLHKTISKFFFIMILILLLISRSSGTNLEKKEKIFGKNNNNPIELYFNDSLKVSTNDSIRLIGKSNDYWYLININQKKTIIYPNSEIKKVVIPITE